MTSIPLDNFAPVDPTATAAAKGKKTRFPNTRKNTPGWFLRLVLRTVQFVLGLTVIGLFGARIRNDSSAHAAQATQWVYALSVGALASATVLVYMIPFTEAYVGAVAAWDAFLTLLYLVAFGIFAAMFEGRADDRRSEVKGQVLSTEEYHHAVWVLLVNVVLWLVTGLLSGVKAREVRRATKAAEGQGGVV